MIAPIFTDVSADMGLPRHCARNVGTIPMSLNVGSVDLPIWVWAIASGKHNSTGENVGADV
eukprot:6033284-Karenia_brevis.AAC.1